MQILKHAVVYVLVVSGTALGQIPPDFELEATTGGLNAFDEITSITVGATGAWTYLRYVWDNPDADSLAGAEGIFQPSELGEIWNAVQVEDFFTLEPYKADKSVKDGAFALVSVTADGARHTVESRNVAISGLNAIVDLLNSLVGVGAILDPGFSVSMDWVDQPVCSPELPPVKRRLSRDGKGENHRIVGLEDYEPAHPGSYAAYRLNLTESVHRRIVTLFANGGYYGPQVTVGVDNTGAQTDDDVRLGLYLEIHGAHDDKTTAERIKNDVSSVWQDAKMSSGVPVGLDMTVRTAAEGQTAGSEGFHQVHLNETVTSGAVSGRGQPIGLGNGTGWVTVPEESTYTPQRWGHVVGHLMGLSDPVTYYRRIVGGLWVGPNEDEFVTETDLAALLAARRPWRSLDAHLSSLQREGVLHVAIPNEGHETDLMATLSGRILSADVDRIFAGAGLVVDVYPGDILVNKDVDYQNFAVTRRESIFAPMGALAQSVLHVACIDYHDEIPEWGQQFDVAPPLADWQAFEAAPVLSDLLSYVDREELYCETDLDAQDAIWRLTDNHRIGFSNLEAVLTDAGIEVGSRILDFPRMSNPAAEDTAHVVLVPPELFVAAITPSTVLTRPGQAVTVNGQVIGPIDEGGETDFGWILKRPAASTAQLSVESGKVRLMPDIRGMYGVALASDDGDIPVQLGKEARITAADEDTETFERSELTGGPVHWTTSDVHGWSITENRARSGRSSIVSAEIDDGFDEFEGDSTSISVSFFNAEPDTLAFAVRVSSEVGFDELKLKINGKIVRKWSGETDWLTEYVALAPGAKNVSWTYVKDDVISEGEDSAWIDDVFFPLSASVTGPSETIPPSSFDLLPVYPNPFTTDTRIRYTLSEPVLTRIYIVDALGRVVQNLENRVLPSGRHSADLRAEGLPSGLYLVVMSAGSFKAAQPVVLVR